MVLVSFWFLKESTRAPLVFVAGGAMHEVAHCVLW